MASIASHKENAYSIVKIKKGIQDEFSLVYRNERNELKTATVEECRKMDGFSDKIFEEFYKSLSFDSMDKLKNAFDLYCKPWTFGDVHLSITVWQISASAYQINCSTMLGIQNISGYSVKEFIHKIQSVVETNQPGVKYQPDIVEDANNRINIYI